MFNKHITCRQAIIFLFVHELFFIHRLVFKLQATSFKSQGFRALVRKIARCLFIYPGRDTGFYLFPFASGLIYE